MSNDKNKVQTQVTTGEADLSMFDLGMSSASVMTTENKAPGANIFSRPTADMKFIDSNDEEEESEEEEDNSGTSGKAATKVAAAAGSEETDDEEDEGEDDNKGGNPFNISKDGEDNNEDPSKGGRPRVEKNALLELTKKLIESKQIVPFADDKPIEKYTVQDYQELFQANFDDQRQQLTEKISKEFWESMPEEVQYIGQYLANGGQNMKQLFTTLAQVEQSRDLNPDDENDQVTITREYLRATNFGSEEEITEEITAWKDLNKLGQKAKQFKPKLDKMSEDRVAQQLAAQEETKKKRQNAAKEYMKSVYDTLEPGELSGIKLDKKTQGLLYSGLVQASYPSVTGRPTNMLGHLMEKYQFVEPNHGLVAEVLWLLSDPDGYKQKIRESAASDAHKKTVKLLKTEESRKVSSATGAEGDDDNDGGGKNRKLSRPVNVFSGKR